ncbi:gelsolin-related protein [Cavenderia fasciculata]|uniref:Gelsolin-related protein n=1 Tax=Cavenderia fasciculata TaxID=261658 RepID=F4PSF4_CACFS|nr:gelsolin-related protein [Cavenderia fasciculata]EGG21484.1 gelsolin-related protein [Cavenderia fasciculata]|eukprot:XP_004359334.1 gelsolin-related protein [Cavenderia fasciculata]
MEVEDIQQEIQQEEQPVVSKEVQEEEDSTLATATLTVTSFSVSTEEREQQEEQEQGEEQQQESVREDIEETPSVPTTTIVDEEEQTTQTTTTTEEEECNNNQKVEPEQPTPVAVVAATEEVVKQPTQPTGSVVSQPTPVVSSVNIHHGAKLIQVTGSEEPYHFINVQLSHSSLNLTDVFIIQSESYMFVWSTDKVHSQKRAKAIQMAQKLKVEVGCQRAVIPLEYGEEHLTFLYMLGVTKGEKLKVTAEKSESMLDENGDELEPEYFLYRVGNVDGKLNVIPIDEEVVTQEMFLSTSCFILDCEHEIFVWQGEKSSKAEREVSVTLAKRFLTMFERPANTCITPVFDGAEGALFKSKFKVWKESEKHMMSYLGLASKKKEAPSFLLDEMFQEKEIPEIHLGSNDHKGKLLVWSCAGNNGQFKRVEEDDFGVFYSNRSYVCHFIYRPADKNSIKSVIFYWEGSFANSRNYISYKFGLYKDIREKMQSLQSDDPTEYRISQNKEPNEFYSLFGRETIVVNDDLSTSKPSMFQVRGADGKCRGTQLAGDMSAAKLCSLDSFVVIIPGKVILVWHGRASNDAERALASDLYTFLPPDYEAPVKEIEEGEEPETFWKILGGRQDYADCYQDKPKQFRFYLTTESTGVFKAEQIKPFSQVDLNTEENAILDRYDEIFVWRGAKTTDAKFKQTASLAKQYRDNINDDRPADTPITVIDEGKETILFKSFFNSWKQVIAKVFIDPLELKKQKEQQQQKEQSQQQIVSQDELDNLLVDNNKKQDQVVEKVEVVEKVQVEQEEVVAEKVEVEQVQEQVEEKREETVSTLSTEEEEEGDKPTPINVEEETTTTTTTTTTTESPQLIVTPPNEEQPQPQKGQQEEEDEENTTGYKHYNNESISVSSNGDLLFAFELPNNNNNNQQSQNSPKGNRKKNNKKKPRNRSLSQSNTPNSSSGTPISKSCELPNFSPLSSSPSNAAAGGISAAIPLAAALPPLSSSPQHSPNFHRKKSNQRHNRTGSFGSPRK